jgi:hypothetical protein
MSKKHAIQCKYCVKVIHGGITRVKYHLANIGGFNVTKCKKVLAPVNQEMEALLTKKTSEKEQRKKEKQRERDEIDLDKSDGSNEEDNEHENDVIVLKSTRVSNNSSNFRPSTNGGSGIIDNFYKPQSVLHLLNPKIMNLCKLKLQIHILEMSRTVEALPVTSLCLRILSSCNCNLST